jgi:hypothetical protein
MIYTREILSKRHRLSHQQIDRWLGENRSKEFLQEKMRSLKMLQHFIGITDLLRQHEIQFTCLKGPLLSQRIYNDPTVRFSHDIDILFDEQQIDSIVQLFLDNGYDFSQGVLWPENKVQRELLISHQHHLSFYNEELHFTVEVHWILTTVLPISSKEMKEIVIQNQTEMTFSGRKFTALNTEFELLYLLLHGSRHGWERLKWLVDINEYPIKEIDILALNKLIKTFKAERIIGQANFLLLKYFNKELPSTIKQVQHKQLNQIAVASIETENILEYTINRQKRGFMKRYLLFPGSGYKCQVIFRTLFRPLDFKVIDSRFKIVYYIYGPYSFIKRRIFHA